MTATHTSGRRVHLVPGRDDLVDAAFLLGLMALALVGFRTTYSGVDYLVAGISGTVLGLLIAHIANALRQPMIAAAAMIIAVFFLLGGAIVLRSTAIAGVLPSGATLRGLADQSIHGWKALLTTLPPVDGAGPLLVLPYILGLLGGVGGFSLARRVSPALAPVAAPFAVLVAVILLGTQTPAARVLQGGVFAVVALAWAALRTQRLRPPLQSGSGRLSRALTIAVLLAVSACGAVVLAPHVPGHTDRRLVFRTYVVPPFNVGQYSSPLAGFRKYTKPARTLYDTTLFTVRGLHAGTPITIATLDAYDGVTWTASNGTTGRPGAPDTFQRVGADIDDPVSGPEVSYDVTIGAAYAAPAIRLADAFWLPTAGALTELRFHGPHSGDHARFFRYNLDTDTGILPDTLKAGDSYSARAHLAVVPLRSTDTVARNETTLADAGAFLKTKAADWAGNSPDPTAQILALAAHLHSVGHYTDGEAGNATYLPGHYRGRLLTFVSSPQVAGDDEQFAAAYALMITQLGVPARVVLGAMASGDGAVRGRDIRAWVEVQLGDGTWRSVLPDTFINRSQKASTEPPQRQQQQQGKIVPPPARGKPLSTLDDPAQASATSKTAPRRAARTASSASGVPAWLATTARWGGIPLGTLLLVCALIVLAKALRRRQRRTRGSPTRRLARGWREVLDHARDLGSGPVAGAATRREQAAQLTSYDLGALARLADAGMFSPGTPDDAVAAQFWNEVAAARRRMSSGLGRGRRMRAALTPRSLFPGRVRRASA